MNRLSFRLLAACSLTLMCTSCTAVFSDVYATWEYATEQRADASLSGADIDQFPYTAVYMRRGDNPRALVVLGYIDGPQGLRDLSWITADKETVVTRGGRVIRTSGLEPELVALTHQEVDPLSCLQNRMQQQGFAAAFSASSGGAEAFQCAAEGVYTLELTSQGTPSAVTVESEFTVGNSFSLELPFGTVEVVKVTETLTIGESRGQASYTAQNYYWLEQDGHVVKSEQHFAPGEAPIEITQVKWVGRDYE